LQLLLGIGLPFTQCRIKGEC